MGYESRIYFVRRYDHIKDDNGYYHSNIVASLEMFKMGYDEYTDNILKAFDTPTDFTLWLPECNENYEEVMQEVNEDKYGKHLMYASNKEALYKAVKIANANNPYYPYFNVFEKLVEQFKGWDNIYIVHYGH